MSIAWIYLDKRLAAIDALRDYAGMEHIVTTCPVDLTDMWEQITSAASSVPTGMPGLNDPHAGEARLAASIDEIDVLKERYRRALEYMEWFRPAWESLNEDDRFVLSEFYVYCNNSQEDAVGNICDRFNIARSSAYNKKNHALARLVLFLYGK